ncbi:DUF6115 domain-containing protein [Salipaludibacillus daqingensis]|uniref:DUF6115 domain-containing protein n=1 Tax=Salipaludibacillus daqingensis TaxID=3041001 RepID=UPI00247357A3|nr:hypothetical protein [Salipaludibacillus daqingensis]
MVYLIIISLVLHLVSFFVIILLYQRMENQKPLDQDKTIREIEDLLVSYTSEMKENNERLVRRMKKMSPTNVPQPSNDKEHEDVSLHDPKSISPNRNSYYSDLDSIEKNEFGTEEGTDYDDYSPPTPDENNNIKFDSSNTANVLSLSKQGYSQKEIAKRLQMGAGEVELLLKFYK